jgi:hypothetical protein
MQRLNVLLFDRFPSNEMHLRTAHRFADRRGIGRIIFLPLRKGFINWGAIKPTSCPKDPSTRAQ